MAAKKPEPKKPKATTENADRKESNLVKIGALWLKTGKGGSRFMSGMIQEGDQHIRLLVFKNNYKEEAKHPDYVIYAPGGESNDDLPF